MQLCAEKPCRLRPHFRDQFVVVAQGSFVHPLQSEHALLRGAQITYFLKEAEDFFNVGRENVFVSIRICRGALKRGVATLQCQPWIMIQEALEGRGSVGQFVDSLPKQPAIVFGFRGAKRSQTSAAKMNLIAPGTVLLAAAHQSSVFLEAFEVSDKFAVQLAEIIVLEELFER